VKTATALLSLSLSLSFLTGCQANAPTAPVTEPKATTSQPRTNEHPDPTNKDCAAISDPAKAEDCRLWKSVEAARKKHNSDNVVKHSPGSIQQP
jgi:uncharacterized lipoprotein YajG